MQLVNNHSARYGIAEKFFIEKTIESLHKMTIDTYRARVMNPKTIIEELSELIKEILRGRIPNQKAIHYSAEEAKLLLEDPESCFLTFSPFSHQTIMSNIGSLLGDTKNEALKKILIVLRNFTQKNNSDYGLRLFDELLSKIQSFDPNKPVSENELLLDRINKLSAFLVTELISMGYTKRFLYKKFSDIFNSRTSNDFWVAYDKYKRLVDYTPTEYNVVFKLEIPDQVVTNLNSIPNVTISREILSFGDQITERSHSSVWAFKQNTGRSTYFYSVTVIAHDLFQALNKGRINYSENLDLIHLGFSDQYINSWPQVLIASKNLDDEYYFITKPISYDLDGSYKGGNDLYKSFVQGIGKIELNPEIKTDTKEKIKSAIRYLRLGNEALEVEHKFINYWVALEYLFSDTLTDNQDNTINKIKRIFPRIHSNIFIKRLLKDYHDNIKRLRLQRVIPAYNENFINYLFVEGTYDWIITNLTNDYPLLAYRGLKLKNILFQQPPANPKDQTYIEKRVLQHKRDLELHLARMYRIRNAIVHDAAIGKNIITITANLKYYLVFIISHVIKCLEENNGLRSIEDLFALDESIYDSLAKEKFPPIKMLKMEAHFDMID